MVSKFKRRRTAGFTLLEMMIVMIIMVHSARDRAADL